MDRSENMRRIRSKGMLPELAVRSLVHRMGFRFRLHRKDLPGKPDLVFVSRRKVIFVHGCFWHAHDCSIAHTPKSNAAYWGPKLQRNQARDARNIELLRTAGWKSLVVWECEIRSGRALKKKIKAFLSPNAASRRAA
ncbi:MAG TPA: DNA mismatch endonuclease Vsr [Candidatus Dormibacteraeota bacterium]|nr:DNA mismatch endonuclease Vsr [Candidatus Dormibacteraeota bacterium]